jgi:hypothetical protein
MTNARIEIIKEELTKEQYALLVEDQDYPVIANQLNEKPLIPNPTPQATVPKIPAILELFGAIAPVEAIEIYKIPGLVGDIRTAAETRNKAALEAYFTIVSGLLSEKSKTAITALLNQTQLDPNYRAQINGQSKAELLQIYPVTASQVQEALN